MNFFLCNPAAILKNATFWDHVGDTPQVWNMFACVNLVRENVCSKSPRCSANASFPIKHLMLENSGYNGCNSNMILTGLMLGAVPLIDVNITLWTGFILYKRNPYLKF